MNSLNNQIYKLIKYNVKYPRKAVKLAVYVNYLSTLYTNTTDQLDKNIILDRITLVNKQITNCKYI